MPSVKALLAEGRIERVPADRDSAALTLEEAQRHLISAEQIMAHDPSGAYSLLYDAARKAVAAHMLAMGYRAASSKPGAHAAVVAYAAAALRSKGFGVLVRHFDRMRRTRHRVEYESAIVGIQQLETDLVRARQIVDVVEQSLPASAGS